MTQSLTQQVNGCSAVESVAGVTVTQPVGASLLRNPSAFRSFLDQVRHGYPMQSAAVCSFPTPENRRANSPHPLCCSKVRDTETREVEPRKSCRPCHKLRVARFHR
jgi:hypothetical protein